MTLSYSAAGCLHNLSLHLSDPAPPEPELDEVRGLPSMTSMSALKGGGGCGRVDNSTDKLHDHVQRPRKWLVRGWVKFLPALA